MNKLILFLSPLWLTLTPYLVAAQTNYSTNDNSYYPARNMMDGSRSYFGGMMGPWGFHMLGWFWILLVVIFWALVISGIVILVKYIVFGDSRGMRIDPQKKMEWKAMKMKMGENDKYVNIVKERYAKGEIDKKEYEEKMKDLS